MRQKPWVPNLWMGRSPPCSLTKESTNDVRLATLRGTPCLGALRSRAAVSTVHSG